MVKGGKAKAKTAPTDTASGASSRRVRRLEKDLAKARERAARRAKQLDEARARQGKLEARLSEARGGAGDATGPKGFCMREKKTVSIVDAKSIVMKNGRTGFSGTCPSCGAHVVTTAKSAAPAT